MSSIPASSLVLAVLLALGACGEGAPREPVSSDDPGQERASTTASTTAEEEIAHLAGLGYADFSEEEADDTGVLLLDRERSCPGYDLVSSLPQGLWFLADPRGEILRTWSMPKSRIAARGLLLPDGDLLAVTLQGEQEDEESGTSWHLARLSWDGDLRWKRDIGAHHDVRVLPSGNIVALTMEDRVVPQVHGRIPLRDQGITIVSPEGETIESYSFWDMFSKDRPLARRCTERFFDMYPKKSWTGFIDLFHANSVERMQRPDLEREHDLYSPTSFLVSMRAQDAIAVLDCLNGRVAWIWGPGELQGPHEARLLANGNVLLFDNGSRGRDHSRILEVDPLEEEIVWRYTAPTPADFYSKTRGTVQELPNGNLLIGNSNRGEAFEIDREGRVVWRFVNPYTDEKGRPGVLRIERYEPELVEEILAEHSDRSR